MLLFGNINSNKTEILIENYANLLNKGISADEILVLLQNSKMKNEFINKTKPRLKVEAITKFNVYSYFGLCYNFVSNYYPVLEEKIIPGTPAVIPNLCGLEASSCIFKNAIEKIVFKGYNSKKNLMHQLLRRNTLITLNALSDDEIKAKTRALRESFTSDINSALNMYKAQTLYYRAFDYLRQAQLFSYIYKNVKNPYKYVFLDDADEITPSLFEYLKFIKKDIKEFFIAYDPLGTSRKGYLCASENDFAAFLNETPVVLNTAGMVQTPCAKQSTTGQSAHTPCAYMPQNTKKETPAPPLQGAFIPTPEKTAADLLFENIKNNKETALINLFEKDFIRADEMANSIVSDVNSLINKGVLPKDILIVVPNESDFLKLYFEKICAPVCFTSGSGKIEENKTVSSLISVLKLLIENNSFKISPYKLRGLLGQVLNVDINTSIKIVQQYETDFFEKNLFEILLEYKETGKIGEFLALKEIIADKSLSEIFYLAAEKFEIKEDIQKINELLKQMRDFENIFKNEVSKNKLLAQLENTIVAENPLSEGIAEENAINICTPQKAIDFKIKNKYMFLVDTTNSNWVKQDIGPLYNAWVFQKNWLKKSYTLEDNIFYSLDKTARVLRKLYLLNNGEIYSYSCAYDFLGAENIKGIRHFFNKTEKKDPPKFKITPRPDQAPVLEYKSGKFAVMAVAGAGKTTIMLALIMKLLENGENPQNIFVLTYMESAARTFKERIKSAFPNLAELPNISTIHGLSMRILRENNNHAHLGLDVDFEIIDEVKRLKLISEIIFTEGMDKSKVAPYERAISAFKNSNYKNENALPPLFKRVYQQYQKALKALNLIDYDDLLLLALTLLKGNSTVREYYQNQAHYVIEDEAQDSSATQQELINILSKKYGNVIRSGDVNQAITSTFTNSDTKGFKKFIETNKNCKMNYTARNSTGVIDFANKLVKNGLKIAPNSFFEIETKPVAGKNIVDPVACSVEFFEKEDDEKKFIIEKIKEIFITDKKASIGILLRTNKEVELYSTFIKARTPFKITTKTDLLSNNQIFLAVLAVFNFLSNPMNNKTVEAFARQMMEFGFYLKDEEIFNKLKGDPFILENNEDFAIWWDLRYFLELTTLPLFELAFKIGEFYFKNDKIKNINIAPVSSLVKKLTNTEGDFENVLNALNNLKTQSSKIIKLNEEETEIKDTEIQIMTLHKSKGDEFDYVFIPGLYEANMGILPNEIKLKESAKIIQSVQSSNKKDDEIKSEIIDENLRLLYVGITRAKKKLYLTCAREYKIFHQNKKVNPSKCFDLLMGGL